MDAKGNAGFGAETEDHQFAMDRSARAALTAVLASVSDGACWLTPDGRLRPLNRAWYRLHGWAAEEPFPADLQAYEMLFRLADSDGAERTDVSPLRRALDGEPLRDAAIRLARRNDQDPGRAHTWSSVTIPGAQGCCLLIRAASASKQRGGSSLVEGLKSINGALASKHDLRQLVQMVTDAGTELSGAEFGAFFYNLDDEQGEAYMLYTLAGPRAEDFAHLPKPRITDIFGATFRGQGVVRLADVTKDPRYGRNRPHGGVPEGHVPVRSYLAAPVISRTGDVLGGLFFGHTEADVFDQDAEQAVVALAAQAAIAIDHSRASHALEQSEERVRRRLAELTAVYDTAPVGLALVTPDLRFARVNARMADLTGVPVAEHIGRGVRELIADLGEVLEGYYTEVLASGMPILEAELSHPVGGAQSGAVWLASFHPLWAGDQVLLGVNTVVQDITARKRHEVRLRLQHEVTNALASAPTLEEAASAILRAVLVELRVPFAALWLLDREQQQLRCIRAESRSHSEPLSAFRSASMAIRFARGQGLPGMVWEQAAPVWIGHISADGPFPRAAHALAGGLVAAAGFPVLAGQTVLGIIEFFSDAPRARDPYTEELMTAIGSQTGQFVKRSEAEYALRRSEERLLFALDAANLGTWEWHQATGEVRWSGNMEQIHGMAPGSFENTFDSFIEDVHPDDRARVIETVQEAMRNASQYRVEYRVNDSDRERWVEGKGRVLLDGTGKPVGMTGVCSDVTERKQSEERFRLAVEASPSAMVMVDDEGRIALTNRQLTSLFGYTHEDLIGQSIDRLLPSDEGAEHPVWRIAERSVERRQSTTIGELSGLHRDGRTLPVAAGLSPLRIGDREYVLCAISDISERKRAEENIRRVNEQLWRKNQEMEQFVYSVSHDLKSPLVTVTGFVGTLKEDLTSGEVDGAMDAVGRIERATVRMSTLINDLLQLSRIGRVEINRQTVDLNEVLGDLRQDLGERFEARQASLEIAGTLPSISADRVRVMEALDNLLSNALKYGCAEPGSKITVGALQQPEETRVYVRDDGPGIAPQYQRKVFQAFQRLSNREEGTGVGLAIVEKIMTIHGGRAWVESEEGKGATFWLAFPERPE